MEILQSFVAEISKPPFSHLLLILALSLSIWWESLFGGFCSDDIEGVSKFSDRFQPEQKLPNGQIIPEEKVDFYQFEEARYIEAMGKTQTLYKGPTPDGKKVIVRLKNIQFNPYIGYPGCLLRWLRLNLGKKFVELGKNKKGHEVFGFIQDPKRHHIFSLTVFGICLTLLYFLLSKLFNSHIAFLATALFSIYPIGCQAVAWISGINYLFSLLGILAVINTAVYFHNLYWQVPLVVVFTYFSSLTLLPGTLTWIILLFFGKWKLALASFLVGSFVLKNQGKEVVDFRKKAFTEQKMERSTFLNWKKFFIIFKTLWYYLLLIPIPKRLGLFHHWGYFYDDRLERPTGMFYLGFFSFVGLLGFAWFSPMIVKFSLLWGLVYFSIFSNVITAQQFVADRYVFIPSIGWCILLSWLLQDHLAIFTFLLGLYAMRSMSHIWTFRDDFHFYNSNFLNFTNNEVALGNLGVSAMNLGLPGYAVDIWTMASKINPLYDVPFYNLYSIFRSNGNLVMAREYLKKCLDAKIVHFPEQWSRELQDLERELVKYQSMAEHINRINKAIKEANYERTGTI